MPHLFTFALGLAALVIVGAWCGARLRTEYRTRPAASLATVALVWMFTGIHFTLVVLAAAWQVWPLPLPRAIAVPLGGALAGAGVGISLAAVVAFRSWRRLNFRDSGRLITTGVYGWSRNPQAVGWTLVLIGVALVASSAMVLLLAAVMWLAFRLYLPLEEQFLERLHGDAYRAYCGRTRRYLGRR